MLGMRRHRFTSRLLEGVKLLRTRVSGMEAVLLGLGRVVGRCGRLTLLLGGEVEFEGEKKRTERV
jgi:ABC-type tungstate transport system substrate-binding protein